MMEKLGKRGVLCRHTTTRGTADILTIWICSRSENAYLLRYCILKMPSFYQDRLGTNEGKTTQKRDAFSYDLLLQIGQGDLDPAGKDGAGAMARSRSHYTQHLMMKSTLLISTVLSGAAKRDN